MCLRIYSASERPGAVQNLSRGTRKLSIRRCYQCGDPRHIEHNCSLPPRQSPGRGGKVSSLVVHGPSLEQLPEEELEQELAQKRAEDAIQIVTLVPT